MSIDNAHTFGGRTYDVPRCAHGCCPDAVCEFVGDCHHRGRARIHRGTGADQLAPRRRRAPRRIPA